RALVLQEDAERGAATWPILYPRATIVQRRESSNERKTDADAGRLRRGSRALLERLEDVFLQLVGDAGPCVVDDDQTAVVQRAHTHPHRCALRGVARSVDEEVLDDAFDLRAVDGNDDLIGRDPDM